MIVRSRNRHNNTLALSSTPEVDATGEGGDTGELLWINPVCDDIRRGLYDTSPADDSTLGDNFVVPPEASGSWSQYDNRIATKGAGGGWGFIWPGAINGAGVRFYSRKRQEFVTVLKLENDLIAEFVENPERRFYNPLNTLVNYTYYLPDSIHKDISGSAKYPVESRSSNALTLSELGSGSLSPYPLYRRWIIRAADPEYGSANGWGNGIMTNKIATVVSLFDQSDPDNFQGSHSWALIFMDPVDGDTVWVEDEATHRYWDATLGSWLEQSSSTIGGIPVNLTAIADGEIIQYDSGSSSFVNIAVPGLSPTPLNGLSDVTISSPTNGQTLVYNSGSSQWVNAAGPAPAPHTLGSHSDTTFSSLAAGQVPRWNGTIWVNAAISSSDLSDVVSSSPTLGQVLAWNGTNYVNTTVPGLSPLSANDLTDVTITSPTTGQILRYNGTNFVNVTLNQTMLPGYTAGPLAGQVYRMDTTSMGSGGPQVSFAFPPMIGCRIRRNPTYTGHLISGGSPWILEYEFGAPYLSAGSFVTFLNPTSSSYQSVYSGTPSNFSNQEVFILKVPSGYQGYYRLTWRLRSNPETGATNEWSSDVVDPALHKWYAMLWAISNVWPSDPTSIVNLVPDSFLCCNRIQGETSGVIYVGPSSALVFNLHSLKVNDVNWFQGSRGIRSLDCVTFEKVG